MLHLLLVTPVTAQLGGRLRTVSVGPSPAGIKAELFKPALRDAEEGTDDVEWGLGH